MAPDRHKNAPNRLGIVPGKRFDALFPFAYSLSLNNLSPFLLSLSEPRPREAPPPFGVLTHAQTEVTDLCPAAARWQELIAHSDAAREHGPVTICAHLHRQRIYLVETHIPCNDELRP